MSKERHTKITSWFKIHNEREIFESIPIRCFFKYGLKINEKGPLKRYEKYDSLKADLKNNKYFDTETLINGILKGHSNNLRINIVLQFYYSKFDITQNTKACWVLKYKGNQTLDNAYTIADYKDLNRITGTFDFIYIHHNKKDFLHYLLWALDHITLKGVVSIKIGLIMNHYLQDLLLLLSQYCTVFLLSPYHLTKPNLLFVHVVLSDFWKINELKSKLTVVKKMNVQHSTHSFMDYNEKDPNVATLLTSIRDINGYLYDRLHAFHTLYEQCNKAFTPDEIEMFYAFSREKACMLKQAVLPKHVPSLIRSLNNKLFKVQGKEEKLHSNINYAEGKFLVDLILKHKCTDILEIGLAFGVSAIFICLALKYRGQGKLVSIDPFQASQWKNKGVDHIKHYLRDDYATFHEVIEQKSFVAMPHLLSKKKRVELVFIDGWHTFDYTLIDFFYADQLLPINGIIVIDDALHPGVAKCVQYMCNNYKHYVKLDSPRTLAAFKKIKQDQRAWNFHEKF